MNQPEEEPAGAALARLAPRSLVLVGAGKMGGAMLDGWLRAGLPSAAVAIVDPNPSAELREIARSRSLALNDASVGHGPADVVVLAVKPQLFDMAAPAVAAAVAKTTLVVSIMAGKTVADIRHALPDATAVVRAMPNLPASIGRGATGAFASPQASGTQRALADRLLSAVGIVEWLDDEALIDAVTAVSGSGPAYLFHLVECLGAAGAAAGLEPGLAERLARATVIGAAELLASSGLSPARLRENVTSPGGTTAAALDILSGDDGMAPLIRRAVLAARARSEELSG